MDRIARLREKALEPNLSWNLFRLHFLRRCEENRHLQSPLRRYADSYRYAMGLLEPRIEEEELIVGLPPEQLPDEDENTYDRLFATVGRELFCPPVAQDSHMAVDYELLLREGIGGVIYRIREKIAQTRDEAKREYYEVCICCLQAVVDYSRRYADCAEAQAKACADRRRKQELLEIARICRNVPEKGAESFHEAIQSVHFLTLCLAFDPSRQTCQQYQLGHPDRYLYPFYCADIQKGTLTPERAQLLLDCLGIQINRRVPHGLSSGYMVGGRDEQGNIVQNELTLMGMQVIEDIRLVYPSVGLCYTEGMEDRYLQKACEILANGRSHPAIFNDDIISKGLMEYGVPAQQAHNYIHSTCVEITPVAASNVWVASPYTNMAQLLLDVMEEDSASFEEFKGKILSKLAEIIRKNFETYNRWRLSVAEKNVHPVLSCFVNDCIERGVDIYQGGARYNWIMPSFVGVANLTDSLYALKTAVFEEKRLTLGEMAEICRQDFEGQEALRQYLLNKIPKYGNDLDEVDLLFREITDFIVQQCRRYTPVFSNAYLVPSVFCWVKHEFFGSQTGATPDGRHAGFPLGDGSGACQGRERNGPLASLLSSTKWSHKEMIGGVAVNVKFSKKVFTHDSCAVMLALIKTYMQRGGFEIQINVTDRETLLDAVAHPENYRDLVVRIGGYSDYFVTLSPNMQQEVLLRTEHAV